MTTALIAGGAGFLGKHLCSRLLAADVQVICVDNFQTSRLADLEALLEQPGFSLIEHDVVDAIGEKISQPLDLVMNLACSASPRHYQEVPIHTMRTCVDGTYNLLELATANKAVFLQASTSEVYGDPEFHPQRETYLGSVNCTGPRACYDEGKRAAEALCFDYIREHGLDARVARIFNTYGPGMLADDGRVVSSLIVQALKGEPLTIYGSGEQTRSFCYVDDMIDGLLSLVAVKNNPCRPINLGNPEEFTINQLASLIVQLTGVDPGREFLPLPEDDPRQRRPDVELAKNRLGWQPRTPLHQGLMPTIDWFARL